MPTEPPMTTKYESADLLLKLYDLRREPVLRKARAWFREEFRPRTAQDVLVAYRGKRSAYYRMVTTYWGMAATLVLHGAIDEQMFADVNGEHIMVYARLRPFLPELREQLNNPGYLEKLEQVIMRLPDVQDPPRIKHARPRDRGGSHDHRGDPAPRAVRIRAVLRDLPLEGPEGRPP